MKRILSILAVVCLVVSLAVPTLASQAYEVYGVWTFNPSITFESGLTRENVNFTSYSASGKTISVYGFSFYNNSQLSYLDSDGSGYLAYSGTGWQNELQRSVDFGENPQVVSETFYNWLLDNASPPDCNGTTCNLADTNYDAICDTCGSPVAMSMRSTLLPDFNHLLEGEYAYATVSMRSTGEYQVMLSKDPSVYTDGNVLVQAPLRGYRLTTDGEWVFGSQSDTPSYITSSNYVGANHAVKDFATGEVWADANFPLPPLWMMVQGGIPITELQPKVVGTMGTLALCGVGCLALLVVLSLFGKRSLISLR